VDRFKRRAHRFIIFGLIPTAFTLYLLAFSPLIDEFAYCVAGLPFAFVYILYKNEKIIVLTELMIRSKYKI
jgi:hypothetical protein